MKQIFRTFTNKQLDSVFENIFKETNQFNQYILDIPKTNIPKRIRQETKFLKNKLDETKKKYNSFNDNVLNAKIDCIMKDLQPIEKRINTLYFQQKERKTLDDLLELTDTFEIVPRINKDYRFSTANKSLDKDTKVHLWTETGESNQVFQIIKHPNGGNKVLIRDCHSGRFIGFSKEKPGDGDYLILMPHEERLSHYEFTIEHVEDYYYHIELSISQKRLDIYEEFTKPGAAIIGWPKKGSNDSFNQQFTFIPVVHKHVLNELNKIKIIPEIHNFGLYQIRNYKETTQVFDIYENSYAEKGWVKYWPQNPQQNQYFMFVKCMHPDHRNCVLIKTCHCGRFVSYISTGFLGKTKKYICQSNLDVNCYENHWKIIPNDKGGYYIKLAHQNNSVIEAKPKQTEHSYLVDMKTNLCDYQLFSFISITPTHQKEEESYQRRLFTHFINL